MIDKEFKSEVRKEFQEFDYVGKRIAIRIFIVVLVIGILSAVGGVVHKRWRVEQEREIFKNSVTYTETAATFLADSYQEYNEAETTAEKTAIMEYVIMRYPNLDVNDIENQTLKNFYNKCLLGGN